MQLKTISMIAYTLVVACGSQNVETSQTDSDSDTLTTVDSSSTTEDTDMSTDTQTGTAADTDVDTDSASQRDTEIDTGGEPVSRCDPLSPPTGHTTTVTADQVRELRGIVSSAETGDTIVLEDGTYPLDGDYLWFSTPGVTLRSASGVPENVVLDGNYASTEIITVAASDVTIAEISITRAYTHPIHVTSSDLGDTTGALIYRVSIVDPREQSIKINPHAEGFYADDGSVACSSMRLTDEGRPHVNPTSGGCYTGGVDAHQARGWTVRDNRIEGFWCPSGLSEHAVHFWTGGRDTVVERNTLIDNARGIGFGLDDSGSARTYEDDPCPQADTGTYVGHFGGVVRNNFIHASSPALLGSDSGFDCGICLASACGAEVIHNTIVSTGDVFSSIEWRFSGSVGVEIHNNLTTHPFRERDGATANLSGNIQDASLALFVDGDNGDLHLTAEASAAIDRGTPLEAGLCDFDIDGERRSTPPDIGADER